MAVRCNRDIDEPQICCKGLVCRESYHQTIHDCLKPYHEQVETLGEPECRAVKRKSQCSHTPNLTAPLFYFVVFERYYLAMKKRS